jgi:hypothetical protein
MSAHDSNEGNDLAPGICIIGSGKNVVGHRNSGASLHAEMQQFVSRYAFEVEAIAGERLGNNAVNESAAMRHSGDSPVQWMGSLHFGLIGVNKGSPLTGQQPYFPAKPTDTRTGVAA